MTVGNDRSRPAIGDAAKAQPWWWGRRYGHPRLLGATVAPTRTPPFPVPRMALQHSPGGNRNATWPRFVTAWDRQLQHAILQVRVNLRRIELGTQRERACEVRLANFRMLHPQARRCRHHGFRLDMEV